MAQLRLLERIRLMEQDPDQRESLSQEQIIASVLGYLSMILNTRQGNAQTAPDLGVPDFMSMLGESGLESFRDIESAMSRVISKYEPRLQQVKIEFLPQESISLSLQFKLQVQIAFEDKEVPVVFETVLDSDGSIMVKQS